MLVKPKDNGNAKAGGGAAKPFYYEKNSDRTQWEKPWTGLTRCKNPITQRDRETERHTATKDTKTQRQIETSGDPVWLLAKMPATHTRNAPFVATPEWPADFVCCLRPSAAGDAAEAS